jgi:hypothetical protein
MARSLSLLLAVLLSLLGGVAHARGSSCEPLKPEQRLSEQQKKVVDAALRGGIMGAGKGAAEFEAQLDKTVEMQVLGEDDLARGWFLYQTCVMKETGLVDEATAQALVRHIMGLAPEVLPTPGQPVERVAASDLGRAAIRIVGRPSTAQVWVDGEPRGQLGDGRVVAVQPGRHKLAIKLPRYKTIRATVHLQSGTEETVEVSGVQPRIGPGGAAALWIGGSFMAFIGVSAFGFWWVDTSI